MFEIVASFLVLLLAVLLVWLVFAAVCDMAEARGHSRALWLVVSLFWSPPFAVMFVLWLFVPLLEEDDDGEGACDGI